MPTAPPSKLEILYDENNAVWNSTLPSVAENGPLEITCKSHGGTYKYLVCIKKVKITGPQYLNPVLDMLVTDSGETCVDVRIGLKKTEKFQVRLNFWPEMELSESKVPVRHVDLSPKTFHFQFIFSPVDRLVFFGGIFFFFFCKYINLKKTVMTVVDTGVEGNVLLL